MHAFYYSISYFFAFKTMLGFDGLAVERYAPTTHLHSLNNPPIINTSTAKSIFSIFGTVSTVISSPKSIQNSLQYFKE